MQKVGLIVISTGEYTKYLPRFVKSFNAHFMEGKADLYIFTNKDVKFDQENITIQKIKHLGWPQTPLKRAEIICSHANIMQNEYLFYIDGDTYFKRKVGEEILSPLTATLHRNLERLRKDFNYEKRPESLAFIAPNKGERYFIGGFLGGERRIFFNFMERLDFNIQQDILKGIRAIWGDESHVNRLLIDTPPSKILGPEYMTPEGNAKFNGRIIHIDKDFKKVNLKEAKDNLKINKADFKEKNSDTKILVTGHKGYIGSRLFKILKDLKYNVIGIDYKVGKDILYTKLPHVDIVFHLAAQSGAIPSMKDPMYDARNNILCSLKLMEAYKDTKFIFTSTGAATVENPASCYGLSKQTCEKYLKLIHLNYIIVRLSSIFGEKHCGVIDDFIRSEKEVNIFGDGEAERDFVHVDDIVEALVKSIKWPSNKEYSLGSGKGTKIMELAKATGKGINILPKREGELDKVVLVNSSPNWEVKIDPLIYTKSKCKTDE